MSIMCLCNWLARANDGVSSKSTSMMGWLVRRSTLHLASTYESSRGSRKSIKTPQALWLQQLKKLQHSTRQLQLLWVLGILLQTLVTVGHLRCEYTSPSSPSLPPTTTTTLPHLLHLRGCCWVCYDTSSSSSFSSCSSSSSSPVFWDPETQFNESEDIYICIYMYVCMYICMYVCMYIYIQIYIYPKTLVRPHTCVYIYIQDTWPYIHIPRHLCVPPLSS